MIALCTCTNRLERSHAHRWSANQRVLIGVNSVAPLISQFRDRNGKHSSIAYTELNFIIDTRASVHLRLVEQGKVPRLIIVDIWVILCHSNDCLICEQSESKNLCTIGSCWERCAHEKFEMSI